MAKKKRKTGSLSVYILVVVALTVIALIVALGAFFKVSEVFVSGVRMYSTSEVVEASGIRIDESIFFLNDSAIAAKIKNALAYVEGVKVIKSLPGTVTLEISESYPIACVALEGDLYVVDRNTKILEKTTVDKRENYIELRGITPIMPKEGDTIALGAENAVKSQYLRDTLSGVMKAEIYNDISWMDFSNISAITFRYKSRFTVDIGKGDKIDDKLWLVGKIVEQHPSPDKGRIDVSNPTEGHYIGE